MCVMAIGVAVSLAQAAVSFAAADEDYQNKAQQWRQNYTNSLAAGRDDQRQLGLRMIQEQEATSQKTTANRVEGAEVSSEAEVSIGGAGLSGISLGNIMVGINRKIAAKQAADRTNHENTIAQLKAQNDATVNQIESRINSVQRPVAPNPLGYALQGIGGAIGAMRT